MTTPSRIPRPFYCLKCGWQLGIAYRESGSRITHLAVARYPWSPCAGSLPLPETIQQLQKVYVAVQVNDGQIICGNCGSINGWYANQTAIAEIIERRSAARASRKEN